MVRSEPFKSSLLCSRIYSNTTGLMKSPLPIFSRNGASASNFRRLTVSANAVRPHISFILFSLSFHTVQGFWLPVTQRSTSCREKYVGVHCCNGLRNDELFLSMRNVIITQTAVRNSIESCCFHYSMKIGMRT